MVELLGPYEIDLVKFIQRALLQLLRHNSRGNEIMVDWAVIRIAMPRNVSLWCGVYGRLPGTWK